jgi:glycine/D-amino acid oxidase-like deaminating enzyme
VRLRGLRRSRAREPAVAVVGAGLPALAAAVEVARRGAPVVVLGPGGDEGSAADLGLVLLGPGRPYSIVVGEIGRPAARLVWAAGCENHLRLRSLLEETGRECGYRAHGSFLVGASRADAEALAESEDLLRDDGFPGEFLDHYMLETRFDVSGFPGAYWAAEDAEVDAGLLQDALAELARASGVAFSSTRVRGLATDLAGMVLETEGGAVRARGVVLATDDVASELLPEVGPLLQRVTSDRLQARLASGPALPPAGRTADGRHAWRITDDGITLARSGSGGTSPEEDAAGLADLAGRLHVDTTGARHREVERAFPVDGRPVIGRLPGRPLAIACGFSGLAPSFAFAAARWVADALLSDLDPTPEPLRPSRSVVPPAAV